MGHDKKHPHSDHSLPPRTPPKGNRPPAWAEPPALSNSSKTPQNAVIYLRKVMVPTTITITNLLVVQSVLGTNYTNAQCGVYNSSGTLLGASAVAASAGTNTFGTASVTAV